MDVKIFTDRRCLRHAVPRGFPECPARLESVVEDLRRSGLEIQDGAAHAAAEETIAFVHELAYIRRFREVIDGGRGFFDSGDNPFSEGTWDAAMAAVEACLVAADWIVQGEGRKAFAAVRPPGHHAERSMAMGFCFFNNVAVAAEYLLRSGGADRIAIVDFDVHHGNGTQHRFEERAEVFYASIHRHPFYPGTGSAGERGRGAGEGTTLNVPLPAGSGDDRYAEAFRQTLIPAIRAFQPDVLVVSAGFDAWQADPIGGMCVTEEAFRAWGGWLGEVAEEACQGRVLAAMEGGYDIPSLGSLAAAYLGGLTGGSASPG